MFFVFTGTKQRAQHSVWCLEKNMQYKMTDNSKIRMESILDRHQVYVAYQYNLYDMLYWGVNCFI